jgi:hypothetical protein
VIALDWFRYAQHQRQRKSVNTTQFLIYNRAWTNTREYRLKLADLLIDNDLVNQCQTSVAFIDSGIHYNEYTFVNPIWQPKNCLENFFVTNSTTSCYSANFDIEDYNNTDIEVVLETLFDDSRLHLTEKSLRPIACGQPFILVATQGSLDYLKSYGFKTYGEIIDETYDTIADPEQRLQAIIETMKQISKWTTSQRKSNLHQMRKIAEYNRQHFFSDYFFKIVNDELKTNLSVALKQLEDTNTCSQWLDIRKTLAKNPKIKKYLTTDNAARSRHDLVNLMSIVNQYKNKVQ